VIGIRIKYLDANNIPNILVFNALSNVGTSVVNIST